ncbi:unnamed protein product [Cyprideis torosa]|uniref:Uncharacterized protein n=1 Tax=Cyprideis torosa TaxID=163714 RepID=A0A7R8W5I8_9CRUS|nr:unnamed protein product [Cyprideis torosa]CAG0880923.1 unnamed protein product [Cyprideis torosa]
MAFGCNECSTDFDCGDHKLWDCILEWDPSETKFCGHCEPVLPKFWKVFIPIVVVAFVLGVIAISVWCCLRNRSFQQFRRNRNFVAAHNSSVPSSHVYVVPSPPNRPPPAYPLQTASPEFYPPQPAPPQPGWQEIPLDDNREQPLRYNDDLRPTAPGPPAYY